MTEPAGHNTTGDPVTAAIAREIGPEDALLRPALGAGDPAPPSGRRTYLQQVIHDALVPVRARVGLTWIVILMFLGCFAPFLANSHPILIKIDGHWSSPLLRHLDIADVVLPVVYIVAAILVITRRLSVGKGLGLIIWIAALVTLFAAPPSWMEKFREPAGDSPGLRIVLVVIVVAALAVVVLPVLLPLFVLPRKTALLAGLCVAPLLIVLVLKPVKPPVNVVYEQYRQMQAAGKVQAIFHTFIPYSPTDRLRDQPDARLQPPNFQHWGGTDNYGADLASRMIHASRIALSIGFIATGLSVLIGVTIGGLMGYFAGWVDLIGMRLIEILEAIPTLVLLIAITAAYGRNLYMMMAVIGLLRWTGDARFIRAEFLRLRNQDFVQAAIASGLPLRSVLFRHMLPNGISPVLVSASFGVASAILLESTLSFLGLGLIDDPSWGEMLNQARAGGAGFNWWIAIFPGMLIFLTVFSYNLIGEAVRDALDPKLLKRES